MKLRKFGGIAALIVCAAVIVGGFFGYFSYYQPTMTVASVLSQIAQYYTPFSGNPSQYQDTSIPPTAHGYAPHLFEDTLKSLRQNGGKNGDAVLLCTVDQVGIYRDRSRLTSIIYFRLGIFIYTVRVRRVLYGTGNFKAGDEIAISESASGVPIQLITKHSSDTLEYTYTTSGWRFIQLAFRPEAFCQIQSGGTYVMFLSPKDNTQCYPVLNGGIGVFSEDYILNAVKTNTLSITALEKQYNDQTAKGVYDYALSYKIGALRTYQEFMK
jgi:hypothetical protein